MIIYLAMSFITFEILSTIFNQFFIELNFIGINFPINISVIFFCLGFFVLDVTTEVYCSKIANKFIYGKILCQLLFVLLGQFGIIGAGLTHSQLADIIHSTPNMVFNGVIASLIGYKLTTWIMQTLKIKYNGKFLALRYMASTLPGEIIFSLVFVVLSFSAGRSLREVLMIFLTLTIIKIVLSFLFSIIVVPVTNVVKYFSEAPIELKRYFPFT